MVVVVVMAMVAMMFVVRRAVVRRWLNRRYRLMVVVLPVLRTRVCSQRRLRIGLMSRRCFYRWEGRGRRRSAAARGEGSGGKSNKEGDALHVRGGAGAHACGFWLASDARPFRALYSGHGRLNLEFDVTNPIILGWVLLVDKLPIEGYLSIPRMCERLTGPCFTGTTGPQMPCSWTSKHAGTLLAKFTAECTSISKSCLFKVMMK
jgi:hypothetical protein